MPLKVRDVTAPVRLSAPEQERRVVQILRTPRPLSVRQSEASVRSDLPASSLARVRSVETSRPLVAYSDRRTATAPAKPPTPHQKRHVSPTPASRSAPKEFSKHVFRPAPEHSQPKPGGRSHIAPRDTLSLSAPSSRQSSPQTRRAQVTPLRTRSNSQDRGLDMLSYEPEKYAKVPVKPLMVTKETIDKRLASQRTSPLGVAPKHEYKPSLRFPSPQPAPSNILGKLPPPDTNPKTSLPRYRSPSGSRVNHTSVPNPLEWDEAKNSATRATSPAVGKRVYRSESPAPGPIARRPSTSRTTSAPREANVTVATRKSEKSDDRQIGGVGLHDRGKGRVSPLQAPVKTRSQELLDARRKKSITVSPQRVTPNARVSNSTTKAGLASPNARTPSPSIRTTLPPSTTKLRTGTLNVFAWD